MQKLKKIAHSVYVLLILGLLGLFPANAIADGFSGASCISSNGGGATYQVTMPGGVAVSNFTHKSFSVTGGIEIAGADTSNGTVSIRSKTGSDRNSHFTKYAKGRIYFSCQAPNDTACTNHCKYCNPSYSYSYDVYKEFPLTSDKNTGNPIVGPVCVLTGDTVTYSVAPWVSMDNPSIGIDRYKWILPSTLTHNILYYSADSSSITFVVNQLTGADTIKTQIGQCNIGDASKITTLALNQSAPKPIITGDVCAKGGAQTVTLWVQNPGSGVTYTWSRSNTNWTFVGNTKGDTIQLITDRYNPSDVYVTGAYSGGGCAGSSDTIAVRRGFNKLISSIDATPSTHCITANGSTTYQYSVNNTAENKFKWIKPTGWTVIGDSTQSSITLKPTLNAASGKIKVRVDASICTESDTLSYDVDVKPGNASSITGTFCVKKDSTYNFSTIATTPAAKYYHWAISGWTILSASSDSLSITAKPTGAIDSIKVTPIGNGASCNGASYSKAVAYPPVAPDSIYSSQTCYNAGLADTIIYHVTYKNGEHYLWEVDQSLGTIQQTYGNGNSYIKVYTKGNNGTSYVKVRTFTNSVCDTSVWYSHAVKINKVPFTVTESAGRKTSTYFIDEADSWYNKKSAVWIYNDADVTSGADQFSTSAITKGLLTAKDSTFYVTVTDSTTGCKTRMMNEDPVFRSGSVISDETSSDMIISPNPTTGKLTISLPGSDVTNNFLYDLNGNLMKKWMRQPAVSTVDVADLISGSYLLVSYQNKNRYTKQFIKK